MKIIEKYSSAIITCSFLLVLFGIYFGLKIPNALLPNIDRPQIALATSWPGKTALEMEQALVAPLEQELSSLGFLEKIQTTVSNGFAWTLITFHPNADMEQMYIDVLSRLNQVPNWPSQVSAPRLYNFSNGAGATLASFFLYSTKKATEQELSQAFRDHVQPKFSKIPGVASVVVSGTPMEQRVDIEFDPKGLAQVSLTINQVQSRLNDLIDRSGGNLTIGSKDYALHFKGQIPITDIESLPIATRGPHIIRLGDIASVHTRMASDWNYFALEGNQSFYFYLMPTDDISVLQTIDTIKTLISELNKGELGRLGMEVAISRDDSKSIRSSLQLVYGSLILGALLACLILYWFLRDLRTLALIFTSIPVCIALVILGMYLGGRSINVISLAGIALSIGLMVDAAIIVIENIQRLRSQGSDLLTSIRQGTQEVTGALTSSTISSVIVFLPILSMQSATGQLFKDLAYTISSALIASMLFALLLLPALARYLLTSTEKANPKDKNQILNRILQRWIHISLKPAGRAGLRNCIIFLGLPAALIVTYISSPSIDVLPDPKQAMISIFINFESPMALEAVERDIGQLIMDRLEQSKGEFEEQIVTYGTLCYPAMCQLYIYTQGDWEFERFKDWINKDIVSGLTGTRIHIQQGGLLRFAMPNSRVSQLDIKGAELSILQAAGRDLLEHLRSEFPDAQITEGSALNNRGLRIEFEPNQDQLIRLGMTLPEFNRHLMALTDGIYIGNFYTGTNTLPFYFKAKEPANLEQLLNTQIMITGQGLIPLRQLTSAEITQAPDNILRVGQEVSTSLNLTPPSGVAMKDFTEQVDQSVVDFLDQSQYQELHTQFRGSANELKLFLQEFLQIFTVALLILALLMYFYLRSMKLALAVLFAIPLSFAGGMLSLRFLNLFVAQNLDVITMIGFVILMGLVVNNAILLVNQFQSSIDRGMHQVDAIKSALSLRIRPIMLTTTTCILGNLPLVFSPGDSATIYRGLAAVISGGMVFSALFVLSFMSALLSLKTFSARQVEPSKAISQPLTARGV
ncbi:efflux RND transporter permease subunit [Microbulbifer sp. GL-2]|uniref:efflux RND transporter permease subunit n=1 Tax=Microbulbifer sp. GL-2 TaxID=2591606 RepID=UPI00116300F9|nr:efflux RND transporter permease subunit [Microbulbifer sp. GL-2]BBM02722.1 acriflavine resistance protein B [Microbulbifer sp. GL-2]